MQKTDAELAAEKDVIKNETILNANSANRIGTMIENLNDSKINHDRKTDAPGTSNDLVATQKGVKDAIDLLKASVPAAGDTLLKLYNLITAMGRPRGGFDASSGAVPTPTADNEAGDFWRITVAGTIGTMVLKVGDVLVADIDDAAVAADFYAIQGNVDQATDSVLGLLKLYSDLSALNVDGSITQSAAVKGIQKPTPACATVSGTNTYTASVSPAITGYEVNQIFFLKFTNGNTVDGPTVAINGFAALTLKVGTTNVPSGFIRSGQIYACMYDGTDLQVVSFLGLNISAAELAAIPNGETNLFTVTKSIDGLMVTYGAGVSQIDNFAGGSLSSLLADSAAWVGDAITLTGDNRAGLLGQTAQEYVISNALGTIYKCVTHVIGTTAVDGSATWIRTRSRDIISDSAVITALETETGWDAVNNTKTITVRSVVGSWYTSLSGYTYFCYGEVANSNWSWRRIGQPDAIFVQITDATLIAEIEAHDFSATPVLLPASAVKGEDRQQHYWVTSTVPRLALCIDVAGVKSWIEVKASVGTVNGLKILGQIESGKKVFAFIDTNGLITKIPWFEVNTTTRTLTKTGVDNLLATVLEEWKNSDGATIMQVLNGLRLKINNLIGTGVRLVQTEADGTLAASLQTRDVYVFFQNSQISVSNFNTEQSIVTDDIGSKTIAVADLVQGKYLDFCVIGLISTNATTTDDLTIRLYLNATLVGEVILANLPISQVDEPFELFGRLSLRANGVSGSVYLSGSIKTNISGFTSIVFVDGVTPVDLSAATVIDVKAIWDVANAANAVKTEQAYVKFAN